MKNFTKLLLLALFLATANITLAKENHKPPATESLRTNLYLLGDVNSTVLADGNLVQYNNGYSAAVNFQDVVKFNNINETFGIMRDNVLLAIERRPIITIVDTLFFN